MSFVKYYFVLLFCIFSVITTGQTNSIQLKDGSGALISSHSSITEAYNTIPPVISQAYVIEIMPEYTTLNEIFPIEISPRVGSSVVNTITVRPASGNSGEVISRALNNNPIFNLSGVSYFILDGRPGGFGETSDLVIENSLNVGAKTNTINLVEGASNNIIRYIKAKSTPRSNAGPRNIYFHSSNTGNTTNNLIEFCEISGGRAGVSFEGQAAGLSSGNIIRKNKIYSFGLVGVWLIGSAENTTIQSCEIFQQETGLNTDFVGGIILTPSGARGTTDIIGNKIYGMKHGSVSDTAQCWGIKGCGNDGSTLNIINNFIALPANNQFTAATHGIFINDSAQVTCNIIYNTVNIDGNQSGSLNHPQILSSGVTRTNTNAGSSFTILNNIFQNHRMGGLGYHVAAYLQSSEGQMNVDFNCYHSAQGIYHTVWGAMLFDSLTVYRSAVYPNEQHSIFKDVEFVSEIDLHLSGTSIGDMDLAGLPGDITYDIDDDIRDPYFPYRGADESEALPVELSSFTSAVSGNNVTLTWTTQTEINNSGFEIERMSNAGYWQVVAFIKGSGTSTEVNNYEYTDKNLTAGNYNYRLKQIDLGGSYTYYTLAGEIVINTPGLYELSQNYPNPFNPSTTIKYSIPEAGLVNITVYNLTGEVVKTLTNTQQAAGNYQVVFDAASLSSGTYFYSIKVNEYTSTRKMLLMK